MAFYKVTIRRRHNLPIAKTFDKKTMIKQVGAEIRMGVLKLLTSIIKGAEHIPPARDSGVLHAPHHVADS
jgi:hypothetical protein